MSGVFAAAAARLAERGKALEDLMGYADRPGIISFAGGFPDPATFPLETFRRVAAAATAKRRGFQYAPVAGNPRLRERVAAAMPFPAAPDEVVITSGSQQGLDLLGKILLDPQDLVLVESPTYLGALQAFDPLGPVYVTVAGDEEGILPEALGEALSRMGGARPKFLYLTPNFQNPTGRTLSGERRGPILELAARYGFYILEDNAYGELYFRVPPPPPLRALPGGEERVIYLGTFSKILAPGLRVGWVVAPAEVRRAFLQAKTAADLGSGSLAQEIMLGVMEELVLADHLRKVREFYARRAHAMDRTLGEVFAGGVGVWRVPDGGFFVWLTLPEGVDTSMLLPMAVDRGVAYVPGNPLCPDGQGARSARLTFSCATEEDIAEGGKRLGEALRHFAT